MNETTEQVAATMVQHELHATLRSILPADCTLYPNLKERPSIYRHVFERTEPFEGDDAKDPMNALITAWLIRSAMDIKRRGVVLGPAHEIQAGQTQEDRDKNIDRITIKFTVYPKQ